MKILSAFLIFCAFAFINCQKTEATAENTDTRVIKTAPFENSQFNIERASVNLPEATTKIHFFDEFNGICLTGGSNYGVLPFASTHAAGGSIYITNDGGSSWTSSYTFSKASSNCARPLGFEVMSDNTIVAFASNSYCQSTDADVHKNVLTRSTDKGKTWTTKSMENTQLQAMAMGDNNILYAVGGVHSADNTCISNTFLVSKDGGLTWNSTMLNTPFGTMSKLMAISPKKMLIGGSYLDETNPQLISTDNGLNWEKNTGGEFMMNVSHGEKMGLYLSHLKHQYTFTVSQTSNGGASWSTIRTSTSTTNEVKVISATTALILGRSDGEQNAGFAYTTDGGKTWSNKVLLDNGYTGELITSSFYSPRNGYIVGANKILYKMTFK
jgi:photosystem II stability/assembly factor-like uncharacterized protein